MKYKFQMEAMPPGKRNNTNNYVFTQLVKRINNIALVV